MDNSTLVKFILDDYDGVFFLSELLFGEARWNGIGIGMGSL